MKRSTTRKECKGSCQKSRKEPRQEAGREEIRGEETGSEESPGKKGRAEKSRAEKSRKEARRQAQTQRCIHEGNDAVQLLGRSRRQQSAATHRSHQENLGLHQEEQAAGLDQQAPDQRQRKTETGFRRQASGVDVRNDQTGLQPPQVIRFGQRAVF